MKRFSIKDLKRLQEWVTDRGLVADLGERRLPKVGFINENACAFLVQTDGGFAMIDLLITRPGAPARAAERDVREVILACVEEARICGIDDIRGFSKRRSVLRLVEKLGFKRQGAFECVRWEG